MNEKCNAATTNHQLVRLIDITVARQTTRNHDVVNNYRRLVQGQVQDWFFCPVCRTSHAQYTIGAMRCRVWKFDTDGFSPRGATSECTLSSICNVA